MTRAIIVTALLLAAQQVLCSLPRLRLPKNWRRLRPERLDAQSIPARTWCFRGQRSGTARALPAASR